jgi:hypothetical protein
VTGRGGGLEASGKAGNELVVWEVSPDGGAGTCSSCNETMVEAGSVELAANCVAGAGAGIAGASGLDGGTGVGADIDIFRGDVRSE